MSLKKTHNKSQYVLKVYDIFEHVAQYLSIEDVISLLLTNAEYYKIYTNNKNYCEILFIQKVLKTFHIHINILDKSILYTDKTRKRRILLKMYWYFKRHVTASTVDFLIYMIDNDISDKCLFRLFVSNCNFKNGNTTRIDDTRVIDYSNTYTLFSNIISFDDMKYLLVYGNENFVDIILEFFTIPVVLISYVMQKILMKSVISHKVDNSSLIKFTKYLFTKHCYSNFLEADGVYIHSIITLLVKYKRTIVLKYFLDKKKKYLTRGSGLDYQYLVNKCIEMEDRTHLKMLLKQIEFDNKRFVNKSFVIINTHQIIEHCKNARFDYMCYLVENCLGNTINTGLYIDSICQGIELLILSKCHGYLLKFENLKRYINSENLETINKTIGDVYNSNNTPLNKRIYI
jgi:hypothetical protein